MEKMITVQSSNFGQSTAIRATVKKGRYQLRPHIHQFSEIVYVIKGEKEYMIPAVKAFILDTDVDAGIMHVRLIEGMEVNAN